MEVREMYSLPFESSFDWRVGLFNALKDLAIESVIEIVTEYKESDSAVEWKDDEGLIGFAFEEDMFVRIQELMSKKAKNLLI